MLNLKKKKKEQEELKAKEAEAAAAATADGEGSGGGKESIFGVARSRKGGGGRRVKPSDLRLQTDVSSLDAGSAEVTWPNPHILSDIRLKIKPEEGLWQGAAFDFSIEIPDGYPHESPKALCLTPIYHPNIDDQGKVCLNILREGWKPVFDLNTVICGLTFLFQQPNPDDPLNHDAAKLMRENPEQFSRNVALTLRGHSVAGRRFPALLR